METIQRHNSSVRRIVARFGSVRRLVIIMLIIAAAIIGYIVLNTKTPEEKAAAELAAVVAAVDELIILPEGDEPVLATVTDAEALIAQQAFFAGAVNGDQLLLFPKNAKAVIYSPSRHIIVNVGPIQNTSDGGQSPSVAPQARAEEVKNEATLSVEVRNGTGRTGLGAEVAKSLAADPQYTIALVSDAKSNDYSKTILYVKSGTAEKAALANKLASLIGATAVLKMPSGEKDTVADVLIILGNQE